MGNSNGVWWCEPFAPLAAGQKPNGGLWRSRVARLPSECLLRPPSSLLRHLPLSLDTSHLARGYLGTTAARHSSFLVPSIEHPNTSHTSPPLPPIHPSDNMLRSASSSSSLSDAFAPVVRRYPASLLPVQMHDPALLQLLRQPVNRDMISKLSCVVLRPSAALTHRPQ
jgi:hypothetical protein